MNNNGTLSLSGRVRSLRLAVRGIGLMLASQKNAWIHAIATVVVCAAGIFFGLSAVQWGLIIVSIIAVWAAEALNTAFEFLADSVTTEFHPLVGKAKDVAAGAVLIAALGSFTIGLLVFVPEVMAFFRN